MEKDNRKVIGLGHPQWSVREYGYLKMTNMRIKGRMDFTILDFAILQFVTLRLY
jgi:hypothetical protein